MRDWERRGRREGLGEERRDAARGLTSPPCMWSSHSPFTHWVDGHLVIGVSMATHNSACERHPQVYLCSI